MSKAREAFRMHPYRDRYATSASPSITPSLESKCGFCDTDFTLSSCNCPVSDFFEEYSQRGSETTPLTSDTAGPSQRIGFDDDKIDPDLPEEAVPRAEFDRPYQAPSPPPPPFSFSQDRRETFESPNPAYEQVYSGLINKHSVEMEDASTVIDMLPVDRSLTAGCDLNQIGGRFDPSANYAAPLPQRKPASAARGDGRHPFGVRTDPVANPAQRPRASTPHPSVPRRRQSKTSRPRAPTKPNPQRDDLRKMGRRTQADSDPAMVCCGWDWIVMADLNRHQRWHQGVPEDSELYCKEHRQGFHKRGDFQRHLQSHQDSLRQWVKCPKFGLDGCNTWFTHVQNVKRHLEKKHNMPDKAAIAVEVRRAKKDATLHFWSVERPS